MSMTANGEDSHDLMESLDDLVLWKEHEWEMSGLEDERGVSAGVDLFSDIPIFPAAPLCA